MTLSGRLPLLPDFAQHGSPPLHGGIAEESAMASRPDLEALFDEGLTVRRDVLGADYVDGSLARANPFMQAFQDITTEMCWGYAWTRPGLDRRTRSFLNLAM